MSELNPKGSSHTKTEGEALNLKGPDALPNDTSVATNTTPVVHSVTSQTEKIVFHSDFSSY